MLVPGAIFGASWPASYYWLPKWTGHMYDMKLGKLHFWLSAIFVNVLFFPQHFLGLAGMPRRIPDYSPQFADWNMVSSIGGFGFGLSQLLFVYVIIKCVRGGPKATAQVWEGAHGLEWTVPSPAPYHTFDRAAGDQVTTARRRTAQPGQAQRADGRERRARRAVKRSAWLLALVRDPVLRRLHRLTTSCAAADLKRACAAPSIVASR